MQQSEHLRIGIRSILAHKLRSLLTTLGIIFGVAAVVSMLSIADGARREAVEQIRLLGTNNVRVNLKRTDFQKNSISMIARLGNGKLTQPKDKPSLEMFSGMVLNAGGLGNDQVKAGCLGHLDGFSQHGR